MKVDSRSYDGVVVQNWLDRLKSLAQVPSSYPRTRLGVLRTWAIAETVYSSGINVMELLALKPDAVDSTRPALGLPDRIVPITNAALSAIQNWSSVSEAYWGRPPAYLFSLSMFPDQPLTTDGCRQDFMNFGDRLGFRILPAQIRESFIHEIYARGMTVDQIAYITGLTPTVVANKIRLNR